MTTRWGLVLVIWAAGLGAGAQYGKVSVVYHLMRDLYPQAGHWLGFSVSMVGVLGMLFGIVTGAVVAALGYRRVLVWCLALGACVSGVQALDLSFGLFLLSRAVEGVSHLGLVVAAPTLIAQLSAERDRGLTLTLWGTFFGVVLTVLTWLGVPLAERHGVTALFAAHAGAMAVLAVVLAWALRAEPPQPRSAMPRLRDLPALHVETYRSPYISAPAVGWLFYTICFLAIFTVIPPYIAADQRAVVLTAMPITAIAVSLTLGVALLRHLQAVVVVQIGFGLCALATLALWIWPGAVLSCLALAGALGVVQGASFAAVPQLNASAPDRARANGGLAQAGNIGNTLGTPLMGLVLAGFGYGGMMALALILFLIGLAAHQLLANRRRTR